MSSPFRKLSDYTPGELLADLKVAEFIKELALGIAEAQKALDENSIKQALELATTPIPGLNKTLIELGLSPPFYHFQYADLEVNMALTMRVQQEVGVDLSASIGDKSSGSISSTSESVGTAELTISQDEAGQGKAVIELKENDEGLVKVAGKTVNLATSPGSGDAQLASSMSASAKNLADALEALVDDNGDAILEDPVEIDMVSDGDVTITSTSRGVEISRSNITVLDEDPTPAKAWVGFSVEDGAEMEYSLSIGTASPYAEVTIGFSTTASSTLPTLKVDPTGVETTQAQALVDLINNTSGAEADAELIAVAGELVKTIQFDSDDSTVFRAGDSSTQTAAKLAVLKSVIDLMNADSSLKILIQGHCDPSGTEAHNMDLGQARADNVEAELIELGAPQNRLSTESKGENDTLSQGSDSQAVWYARCRRVEFHLKNVDYRCVMILTSEDEGSPAGDIIFDSDNEDNFELLDKEDGEDERRLQNGDTIVINGVTITAVDPGPAAADEFVIEAGDPEATAEALADAIEASANPSLDDVSAVANDATVAVSGEGATVLLTLTSAKSGATASSVTLSASGSLRVSKPFSGAKDAKEPQPGDTVTIGSTVFAVADPDDSDAIPDGADATFAAGDTAEDTARSLAAKINDVLDGSFSAAVSGSKVTIAGKPGTALAVDSETNAFKLSSKVIGGQKEVKTVKENRAKGYGVSLDVHYSKKYDLSMSGNSSIKARLVAIPAPADLLDEIKAYLSTE